MKDSPHAHLQWFIWTPSEIAPSAHGTCVYLLTFPAEQQEIVTRRYLNPQYPDHKICLEYLSEQLHATKHHALIWSGVHEDAAYNALSATSLSGFPFPNFDNLDGILTYNRTVIAETRRHLLRHPLLEPTHSSPELAALLEGRIID